MLTSSQQQLRKTVRSQLRLQRRSLTREQQLRAAELATQHFSNSEQLLQNQHIAIYCANDGEIDTQLIIELAWRQTKNIYLPIISSSNTMDFVPYEAGDKLEASTFGMLCPAASRAPVNPSALELIIAPLVAFDTQGNRLGRGGGFYDRYMQGYQAKNSRGADTVKPMFVGLAHRFQQVESLYSANWDIPLDAVITEEKLTFFNH